MLNFSEISEFSRENNPKIPILKEFEWFEWFGPSAIEPFNSGLDRRCAEGLRVPDRRGLRDRPLLARRAVRVSKVGRIFKFLQKFSGLVLC